MKIENNKDTYHPFITLGFYFSPSACSLKKRQVVHSHVSFVSFWRFIPPSKQSPFSGFSHFVNRESPTYKTFICRWYPGCRVDHYIYLRLVLQLVAIGTTSKGVVQCHVKLCDIAFQRCGFFVEKKTFAYDVTYRVGLSRKKSILASLCHLDFGMVE